MDANGTTLLKALENELRFLEGGGYRRHSWRPLVFEDSPTCLNYHSITKDHVCAECPLMQLVPEAHRKDGVPCREIPLDDKDETLTTLYRWAAPEEAEACIATWLKKKIAEIKSRSNACDNATEQGEGPPAEKPMRRAATG